MNKSFSYNCYSSDEETDAAGMADALVKCIKEKLGKDVEVVPLLGEPPESDDPDNDDECYTAGQYEEEFKITFEEPVNLAELNETIDDWNEEEDYGFNIGNLEEDE